MTSTVRQSFADVRPLKGSFGCAGRGTRPENASDTIGIRAYSVSVLMERPDAARSRDIDRLR